MADSPRFVVDYQLGQKEQKQLSFQLVKLLMRSKVFIGYATVMAAIVAGLTYESYDEGYTLLQSLLSCLPLIMIVAALPLMVYLVNRLRLKELAKKFPDFHYEFYEDYLLNRTQGTEGKVDYPVLDRLVSTKAGLLIKCNRQYFFIPAASVSPELTSFLRTKIAAHT